MMAVFAFALGLLVRPPAGGRQTASDEAPIFAPRSATQWSREPVSEAATKAAPADFQWPATDPDQAHPAASEAQRRPNAEPPPAASVNWPTAWQHPVNGPAAPATGTQPPAWPSIPDDKKP